MFVFSVFSGPLSGALCAKIGPRGVTMMAGVVLAVGAVMTSRSRTVEFLVVSHGVTSGRRFTFDRPLLSAWGWAKEGVRATVS